MKTLKNIVATVIKPVVLVLMHVIRWCASDMAAVKQIMENRNQPKDYVTPDSTINVLTLSAALADHDAVPANCQPILNACLESLRSGQIGPSFVSMLGALCASGYPWDESFYRVLANVLCIGMHLNRRLLN